MSDSTFHILVDAATQTTLAVVQTVVEAVRDRLPAALGAQGALKVEGVASGTVIPVSDGGGSLTVDGTVALDAGSNTIGAVTAPGAAALATAANQDLILTEIASAQADHDALPPTALSVVGGLGQDVAPTVVTDGDAVRAWFTRAGALRVDPTGATTQPVSGTVAVSSAPTTATTNAILDVATGIPNNATTPTRAIQIGGLASTTAPAGSSTGRLVGAWFNLVGALMTGVLGRDGAALASATNGVPVSPETSSVWDVSSRAARLIGALTGVDGAAIASGANPVPVQLSTGAAVYTGAQETGGNLAAAATDLETIAGAVGAHDVALPAGAVVEAGIGQTAAPTAVTSGRAVRAWRTLAGAAYSALLGVDGAAIATAANPVPVRLSDGSAMIAMGIATAASSFPTVRSVPSVDKQATLATAGKVIKASPGIAYSITYHNNTGAGIYIQIFNKTSAPSASEQADYFSSLISSGTKTTLGLGAIGSGEGCSTGITLAISSTQETFTAQGSTAFLYSIKYD